MSQQDARTLADYRCGIFDTGGTCEVCDGVPGEGEPCYYFPDAAPENVIAGRFMCERCAVEHLNQGETTMPDITKDPLFAHLFDVHGLVMGDEDLDRIALAVRERESAWTSAAESLPPPGTDVLVTDGKAHWIASQVCGGIWNSKPWRATPPIRHWMPLPALPTPEPNP